jgi:hypothetical protein
MLGVGWGEGRGRLEWAFTGSFSLAVIICMLIGLQGVFLSSLRCEVTIMPLPHGSEPLDYRETSVNALPAS